MDNQHANEIDELVKRYRDGRLRIIQQSAGIALAFFKQSFVNQGFTNKALVKWKKRIGGERNEGRAILVNRAVLKRGIRIKKADKTGAIVGVDPAIKYAEIHNYGGEIPVTPKMRRFFWAMYYKHGGADKRTRGTELAQFWLKMALTKKKTITIPQRQFIGDSVVLARKLTTYIEQELTKILLP